MHDTGSCERTASSYPVRTLSCITTVADENRVPAELHRKPIGNERFRARRKVCLLQEGAHVKHKDGVGTYGPFVFGFIHLLLYAGKAETIMEISTWRSGTHTRTVLFLLYNTVLSTDTVRYVPVRHVLLRKYQEPKLCPAVVLKIRVYCTAIRCRTQNTVRT